MTRAPSRWAAVVALGAVSCAGAAAERPALLERSSPPPIAWREPAPLARLFLQLPFEAPEVVPPRALEAALALLYSNSVLLARSAALALDVHVETAAPTLLLRYGVAPHVEAEVAVPAVLDYGGFLDRPIERVEGWFGFANPQRQGRPRDRARFRLAREGGAAIARDGTDAGLGDVWAGVKASLRGGEAQSGGNVAARAAVKVPTGRPPFGSGETDVGGSVMAGWTWRATSIRLQVDVVVPTSTLAAVHLETHVYAAGDLGFTWRVADRVALELQASGHLSPLARTGLAALDDATAYVLAGVSAAISPRVNVEVGVSENVFSPYRGADITFPLVIRARF